MSQQPGSFSISSPEPATFRMRPGELMSGERQTRPTYTFTITCPDVYSDKKIHQIPGASFEVEKDNLLIILNANHQQVAAFTMWDSIIRGEQSDE